jgi:hypothetical protein
VTPRHVVLAVATLAVLAMGLYLFKEVRATPATANVVARPRPAPAVADHAPEVHPPDPRGLTAAVMSRRPREVVPPTPVQTPVRSEPPQPTGDPIADELARPNPKLDAVMSEANKAYDRGDFDEAKGIAIKVLAKDPANVRMLRIVVSSSCIDGDSTEAQRHYLQLPAPDRQQMKVRCARYGVTFDER